MAENLGAEWLTTRKAKKRKPLKEKNESSQAQAYSSEGEKKTRRYYSYNHSQYPSVHNTISVMMFKKVQRRYTAVLSLF